MKPNQSNVERFYSWMLSINNKFLHDNEKMCNAFHIVALNDIEVVEPVIVKPNQIWNLKEQKENGS